MARDNTVEIIEAVSKAMVEVAKAVGEGIGRGLGIPAEALPPVNIDDIYKEAMAPEDRAWFPDVERDGAWIGGEPDASTTETQ